MDDWRATIITKLAILIDPNKGEATERMFHSLKEILTENSENIENLPLEIWVGDSKEIFRGVHRYLKRLKNLNLNLPPIVIFPGHPFQISKFADFIQMPTLLNCQRFRIKVVLKLGKKYHFISKWFWKFIPYRSWPIDRKYGYLVLAPYSSVGKKLRAKELSDDEAYKELTTKWRKYWWGLYLEAGSGNVGNTIANRLDLVSKAQTFAHERDSILITGGGIQTKEQIADLVKAGSDIIVVSTVLEKSENPKKLMVEFLESVQ
ncbi:MAG: geranylgeranylglyceryl/heptaprenylglyceryl phosphate synthase [Candidatus Hodarchaeales archaeon]|jgi:heptaprenylglyceryl phosphate synthase